MSVRVASGRSLRPSSDQAAQQAITQAVAGLAGAKPTLAIVFAAPVHALTKVLPAARKALPDDTALIGCTTAGELTETGLTKNGIAALVVADEGAGLTTAFADKISANPEAAAEALIAALPTKRKESISVVLVDALTGVGETVVDMMHSKLGRSHQIVGGAAGDDGKLERTYVGTDTRVASDAAVALHIASNTPWAVGVDHGFIAATEMMRVTRASGTTVYELDGKPVLDVYKAYAKKRGVVLDERNAARFLINNELGVYVHGQFRRARAPLALTRDKGFACAAPIPEKSMVAILKGDETSLIKAARAASLEAKDRLRGRPAAGVLVFDCICRATILGDAFPREIAAIQSVFPGVPLAGFNTYGEVGRYSGQLDGWHNASVVVVAIPG